MNENRNRVRKWVEKTFGSEIADSKLERNFRFLEESLELVQSLGMTKEQILTLVDYTMARPAGEPEQELGGVLVTLMALCGANNLGPDEAFSRDMKYCEDNADYIKSKRDKKPIEITYKKYQESEH